MDSKVLYSDDLPFYCVVTKYRFFPEDKGVGLKAKCFKVKYEALKLGFFQIVIFWLLGERRCKLENATVLGIWIFFGTIHFIKVYSLG